jgi:hypothetical protein
VPGNFKGVGMGSSYREVKSNEGGNMSNRIRRYLSPVLVAAVVAALLGGAGMALAGQTGNGVETASASRTNKKKHRHRNEGDKRGPRGKRGHRGRRGPRGAAGPQGAQGPQGAPGVGIQFGAALPTDVPPTVVFNQSGLKIEARCSGGVLSFTARPTAGDHNIIQATSFDNTEGGKPRGVTAADLAVNLPVDMLAGGSGIHDYNGLLSMRSLSGEVVTVSWFAMSSLYTSQGDCVVGGTASP